MRPSPQKRGVRRTERRLVSRLAGLAGEIYSWLMASDSSTSTQDSTTVVGADADVDVAVDVTVDVDVIVIGAGVCGIYQLYRLLEMDLSVTVLEAGDAPGGTWYWNRYPGARFDSESYTYGFSFSKELLDEWDWSEHFSPQPETLRYLNYVVDKFDLAQHMQFGWRVERATWDEGSRTWEVTREDGTSLTCRYLLTALGLLSVPALPNYDGMDSFTGQSFHTFHWPKDPVNLEGKRVAVIGTGATAVQLIPELAKSAGSLTVFQRRPNWCAPLHNGPISPDEMAEIRARYDEIFERCANTPGGFIHGPDPRSFHEVSPEERHAFWQELYEEGRGFGIWLANFREVLMDEECNAEFTEFIANKIRDRVDDPVVADKLIPKDHGFGIQRVPMETNYYEAYNRPNVHLVDLNETPIETITSKGVRTADTDSFQGTEHEFDIIVYATGFDAITGAFDKIDFIGVDGQKLRDKWVDSPITFMGALVNGFPNLITLAGPTAGSVSTNFPRGIEIAVDWASDLLTHMLNNGQTRVEASAEAERAWTDHVREMYGFLLLRKAKSWFTGYNANLDRPQKPRYMIYTGGNPRYRKKLNEAAAAGYEGVDLD